MSLNIKNREYEISNSLKIKLRKNKKKIKNTWFGTQFKKHECQL